MQFDIVTIFPGAFQGIFEFGIVRRAIDAELIGITIHDLRDYTSDRHHQADDRPFGGGPGMVMKPEPLFRAVEAVTHGAANVPTILLSPQGRVLDQQTVQELAQYPRILLLCGRYEGIDERVVEYLVTDEISIGDYVLSGGEIPAMVVIDAVTRLLPGALGSDESARRESFSDGLLDYPQYTRPAEYRGFRVPEVLLGGNHAEIERWRKRKSLEKTRRRRPELLANRQLTNEEQREIKEIEAIIASERKKGTG
jgi:tRNA (guanine37-N1)-methyltransferase